jgi:hypothetical protein
MCLGSRSQVSEPLHKRPSSQLFEALLDVELTSADGHLLAYFDSQPSARSTEPPESATDTQRSLHVPTLEMSGVSAAARRLRSLSPVAAVLLRSRVPGTAGTDENGRPRVRVFFAAFVSIRGDVQASEPATFHRGEGFKLALQSRFPGIRGHFAVVQTGTTPSVRLADRRYEAPSLPRKATSEPTSMPIARTRRDQLCVVEPLALVGLDRSGCQRRRHARRSWTVALDEAAPLAGRSE